MMISVISNRISNILGKMNYYEFNIFGFIAITYLTCHIENMYDIRGLRSVFKRVIHWQG